MTGWQNIAPLSPDNSDALGHWRLRTCYDAARDLIGAVYFRRNESLASLHEPDLAQPKVEDPYVRSYGLDAADLRADEMFMLDYEYVSCSLVAVAVLAPFFQTLFQRAADEFREVCNGCPPVPDHVRCHEKDNIKFWKSDAFWNNDEGHWDRGVVRSLRQLLSALGHDGSLKTESWKVLEALFAYRNQSLHNSFEWPKEVGEDFSRSIKKRQWDTWFQIEEARPEIRRGWQFWFTDTFVNSVIKQQVDAIARDLWIVSEELRQRTPRASD